MCLREHLGSDFQPLVGRTLLLDGIQSYEGSHIVSVWKCVQRSRLATTSERLRVYDIAISREEARCPNQNVAEGNRYCFLLRA